MKKLIISIVVVLLTINISKAQTKSDEQTAYEYGVEAIKIMDQGDFDKAIELLEKAEALDPDNIAYPYEIAYALYSKEEYKSAIKILKKYIKHKDVSDRHFQLLGNCYDNISKPDKAIETYKQGLELFPNSGSLYLEQGIVEYFRENYNIAISLWEKGVEVDPNFPSNYYWLSKIFSQSDERIWSVLYGEIFINLERGSNRTSVISKLLYDTYKESITITSDTSGGVSFSKVFNINPSEELKIPFSMNYGLTMTLSLATEVINKEKEVTIKSLDKLRQNFINYWYEQERDKEYNCILFDYQKLLKEKGYFESYNYWIFMKGREDEFGNWYETNEQKFEEFIKWFTDNPLEINSANYFSRLKY